MSSLKQNPKIGAIQSLRAIAALLVVIQHVTVHVLHAKGIDFQPYLMIDYGRIGVLLFFTISGFVMVNCMADGWRFIIYRVARIYPGFWMAIAFSSILLSAPKFEWHFDITSALLIPTLKTNDSYKIPYWTLIYEVAFYVVLYVIVLLRTPQRLISAFCIGWLVIIVGASKYIAVPLFVPGEWVLLSPANAFFICGMLGGLHREWLVQIPSFVSAATAVVCWSIGDMWKDSNPMQSNLLLAIAFLLTLMLSLKHLRLPAVERLGNISYGVYLVHVPIALAAIEFFQTHAPSATTSLLWLSTFGVAIFGSSLYGLLEYQLYRTVFRYQRKLGLT